jgi:diguanylate cyclase (GGDEF)-like protein
LGAAEIFEEHHFVPESDRRQDELGKHGCLDEGTALPNHGLMVSYLREQLNLFTEHGIPFGVFVIQPERLEIFQAAHGLEAARAIVRVVAHTLKNALRPTDFLGRWRDDQFLGILSGCQEDFLGIVAQRLKATVSGSGIQWWGDRLSLAVSIGWTGVVAGDTVEAMVERAESALKAMVGAGPWLRRSKTAQTEQSGRPVEPTDSPDRAKHHQGRRQVGLRLGHLKIIRHREYSGNAVSANSGDILVAFAIDDAFQGNAARLHDDANRLLHAQGVPLEGARVDGAIEPPAQLVIHGGDR